MSCSPLTIVYSVTDTFGTADLGWVIEHAQSVTGPYFWPVSINDRTASYPRTDTPWIMPPPSGDERVTYLPQTKDIADAVAAVRAAAEAAR